MQEIMIFFGRFHPLLVHLPIGIILFAFILELSNIYLKSSYDKSIGLAYWLTALSGAGAALVGYFLSTSGGYEQSALDWHKWLGILTCVMALILAVLKSQKHLDRRLGKLTLSQSGLFALIFVISVTGHLGGNLTHGETYLTEYMPKTLKGALGMTHQHEEETKAHLVLDSVNIYSDVVRPIFKAKCVSCHNPAKMKGGLDMSSMEGLKAGGGSGSAIDAKHWEHSEVFKRVTLPKSSVKFMPPDNKPALTNIEIDLLKYWVKNGASFDSKLEDLGLEEKEKYLMATYLGLSIEEKEEVTLPEVAEADNKLLETLDKKGLVINYIADGSNLLDISFVSVSKPQRKEVLNSLKNISAQVYKLNLSNNQLTDQDLEVLKDMKNLSFLRLDKNQIKGNGLQYLENLTSLKYLNLNFNPLTESAKGQVKRLSQVEKLYLWETGLE